MTFDPSPEQQQVIDHPLGPLRVNAGAGTGKTTTMALRLVNLLGTGQVASALGVTFTNKASEELRQRIEELAALAGQLTDTGDVEVTTYHGFAANLLLEFGAYVGVERTARLVTPGFVRQLLRDALGGGSYEHLDLSAPGQRVEELAALAGQLADNLRDPESVPGGEGDVGERRAEMLAALTRYRKLKHQLGVIDFSDLIALAHRLVVEQPAVAAAVRGRFGVVLLDEYQDTNPAQRELLSSLFGDAFPVTAVGDADQTIYEWRGASLENFARFPEHFPGPDGTPSPTLQLSLNRRSGHHIVTVANTVAEQISRRANREPLRALDTAGEGEVATAWFRTAGEEADWLAAEIISAHEAGLEWRDIALIFRKNAQIPLIRQVLAEAGVPIQVVSLGGLLHVPEVTDLWSWLRILEDPSDGPALLRILLGPHFGLGFGDLVPPAEWVREQDGTTSDEGDVPGFTLLEAILEVTELPRPEATTALERFRSLHSTLVEEAQGVSLVELCRRVLDRLGVWIEIDSLEESASRSARLNLYRFLDLAEAWSPLEGRPSLTAFLEYLALLVDERAAEELDLAPAASSDAVTLITAHRAKGLEWDSVYLPAVVNDTFPSRPRAFDDPFARPASLPFTARLDAQHLPTLDPDDADARKDALRDLHTDQEWRTAYVALTRAKKRLVVSGAHWYGQKRAKRPSDLFSIIDDLDISSRLADCEDAGARPDSSAAPPRVVAPDPHFGQGWQAALLDTMADPQWPREAAADTTAYDAQVEQLSLILSGLPEPEDAQPDGPTVISVSSLVTYATCPKRFYWSEVDRLPRRPAPWLRAGIDLHRRIELHNRGVIPLEVADEDTYDFVPDEQEPSPDSYETFQASRFATTKPTWVERPFVMQMGDNRIRGRIDAIYTKDRFWEIVDFKSGRNRTDPARQVQLQAYGVAADEGSLGSRPDSLAVTFAYFGNGLEEESTTVDTGWLDTARSRLTTILEDINTERFEPEPSEACRHCDFVKFCEPGRQWLADNQALE